MILLQKKGDQKSLIESVTEEDFLSLGAEACNFMQAPTIKQKNPPPVLPKPAINPAHPPWSAQGRAVAKLNSIYGHTQDQAVTQQNPPKQPGGKAWPPLSSQPIPQEAITCLGSIPHTRSASTSLDSRTTSGKNIQPDSIVLVLPSLKHHGLGQVMVTLLLLPTQTPEHILSGI